MLLRENSILYGQYLYNSVGFLHTHMETQTHPACNKRSQQEKSKLSTKYNRKIAQYYFSLSYKKLEVTTQTKGPHNTIPARQSDSLSICKESFSEKTD